MFGEYRGWTRTSQPSHDSFFPCHQRNMWSCIILMEDSVVLLINSTCFLLSAAISWSNWRCTYWNSSFGFPKGAHNRELPSKPTIYKTSPSLNKDWPLVVGWWWFILLAPWSFFYSILLCSIDFSLPITVCFKNGTLCYGPVENHMQKRSQEDFPA